MVRRSIIMRYTRFAKPEGAHDTAFMKLLKTLYSVDDISVEIKKGHGGDQKSIVREAVVRVGAFDERIAIMDGDRPENEMREADDYASENGVKIIRIRPCCEKMLIQILEPNKRTAGWSSQRLKDYFCENYISEEKRADMTAYKAKFPKNLLDEARERIPELDTLIRLFEEK